MSDPYQVLGISPSATEEEITKAYRKLVKQYHPDLHPGDENADKKMREINAAYEQIKAEKRGGGTSQQSTGGNPYGRQQYSQGQQYGQGQGQQYENPFGGFGSFGGFGPFGFGGYQQQQQRPSSPKMQAVQNFVMNRQYTEALRVLQDMNERTAEWYYYSAVANAGLGNRVTALNHAREAVRLDPNNYEYQFLLQQIERGGSQYRQTGQAYGFGRAGMNSMCLSLCIAQTFCNFCCRPF